MTIDPRGHVPALESSFLEDGWRAVCSCGWSGPLRLTSEGAQLDHRSHLIEATDAPEGGAS